MNLTKRTGNETPRFNTGKTHKYNRLVRFVDLNESLREIEAILKSKVSDIFLITNEDKSGLGEPVNGVYKLKEGAVYIFFGYVDLMGLRLEGSFNTAILGYSSENAFLTSTGLDPNQYLITANYTMPVRHISFENVQKCFYIDSGLGAFDWTGVNFLNIPESIKLVSCDNFIFDKGAWLSSGGVILSGAVNTSGINNSLLAGDGSNYDLVRVEDTAVILRRFRITYSSIVAFGATKGVNFSASATVPTESFILDTVNFSGSDESQYLPGINHTSNSTLFVNCVGITNTSVNGQMYMRGNAVATVIPNTSDYVKIAGVTLPSTDNEKYDHASNRLTNKALISRKYLVMVTLSFNSGNNNVCEFGIYDSKLGGIR
jgi:hypothetical protein